MSEPGSLPYQNQEEYIRLTVSVPISFTGKVIIFLAKYDDTNLPSVRSCLNSAMGITFHFDLTFATTFCSNSSISKANHTF